MVKKLLKKKELYTQKCLNCNGNKYFKLYSGKIRSGSYGKETKDIFHVLKCSDCGLTKLKDFPKIGYDSSDYRQDYNDSSDVESYMRLHDFEQSPRLGRIGIEKFRNKVVLDFGCGGGSFLDSIQGFAGLTIGIEPYMGYHKSLSERSHKVFRRVEEAENYKGEIDIVTSFGVIEHVRNPLAYLKDIYEFLSENGTAFIETENLNDVLMHFDIPEFKRFFYRTAHLWYFNADSLNNLCQKTRFSNVKLGFRHRYDLSNTFQWLKERKPTGIRQLSFIDPICNEAWRASLEESGMAELLFFEVTK